jgi:tetratricopeptide (TPR) repeat protein
MLDWLRLLLMVFYAPASAMRQVRDRASLAPAALVVLLTQVGYLVATGWLAGDRTVVFGGAGRASGVLFQAAITVFLLGGILVPIIAFVGNLFERRGSFTLFLQQEYVSLASVFLFALGAANLLAILSAVFLHFSGIQAAQVASSTAAAPEVLASAVRLRAWMRMPPEVDPQLQAALTNPQLIAATLFRTFKYSFFIVGAILAVRTVFRVSVLRAVAVLFVSFGFMLLTARLWTLLLTRVLVSPFLLLMLFFLLRGYFQGIMQTQRARASFKQNLEASTLNPADASAHYNLGLIHQQRGEFDAARERFERAVQIDADEIDGHYQLGRIARQQKRSADAIKHFEQVVARDQSHSQYEIWREVGATYLAAGQFEDARTALERFLDHRESDPEGLYLMGRAHAGLGHRSEAASLMEACINAVKSAPAYKYRLEKRWLNEAQQFMKSSQ